MLINNPIECKTSPGTAKGNRLTVSGLFTTILTMLWMVVPKILALGLTHLKHQKRFSWLPPQIRLFFMIEGVMSLNIAHCMLECVIINHYATCK